MGLPPALVGLPPRLPPALAGLPTGLPPALAELPTGLPPGLLGLVLALEDGRLAALKESAPDVGRLAGLVGLLLPNRKSESAADADGFGPLAGAPTEARPLGPLTGALAGDVGGAHNAPGAGGGGGAKASWSSPAGGLLPSLSGVACRSSMNPPDRALPTVRASGAAFTVPYPCS
jgi:hypothetical protein